MRLSQIEAASKLCPKRGEVAEKIRTNRRMCDYPLSQETSQLLKKWAKLSHIASAHTYLSGMEDSQSARLIHWKVFQHAGPFIDT